MCVHAWQVPVCDKERLTMKMNWFSQKKVEKARANDTLLKRWVVFCLLVLRCVVVVWVALSQIFIWHIRAVAVIQVNC